MRILKSFCLVCFSTSCIKPQQLMQSFLQKELSSPVYLNTRSRPFKLSFCPFQIISKIFILTVECQKLKKDFFVAKLSCRLALLRKHYSKITRSVFIKDFLATFTYLVATGCILFLNQYGWEWLPILVIKHVHCCR